MANARPRGVNPLLVHSLRQFMRARRKLGQRPLGQWIILLSAAAAYLVSLASWWHLVRPADKGAFSTVVICMMIGLGLMVPGLSAGVFAQERQNGTLDLLLTCPLTNRELVRGKLLGQFLGPLTIVGLALPFLILATPAADAAMLWGATLSTVPPLILALVCLGVYCSARVRSAAGARAVATGVALTFGLLLPMLDAAFCELSHHSEPTWSQIFCPCVSYLGLVGEITEPGLSALGPIFLLVGAVWCFARLELGFDRLVRNTEYSPRRSADA
ncbi:MAG: ABC transporter permease subunit [Armatimonadetes bacterium]|nr:ABC transporter permease subunit [Armatimonadota bacterium]